MGWKIQKAEITSLRWGIFGCYRDDRTGMNLEIRQDATGRWYLMMSTKHRILSDPDGIYKSDRMTLEKDVSYIFISCFIIHQCININKVYLNHLHLEKIVVRVDINGHHGLIQMIQIKHKLIFKLLIIFNNFFLI